MNSKKRKKHSVKDTPVKIEVDTGQVYCINGVKINFPVKAYPTQITMMNKILQGIERKQNCLLESPTGSGKSLALLCSCLAWHTAEKARLEAVTAEYFDNVEEKENNLLTANAQVASNANEVVTQKEQKSEDTTVLEEMKNKKKPSTENDDDDDDFVPLSKKLRRSMGNAKRRESLQKASVEGSGSASPNIPQWKMETVNQKNEDTEMKPDKKLETPQENNVKEKKKELHKTLTSKIRLPKIYFGTRTHKQIAQIIRELRKTKYKDVKMTILGSREHLCIHPAVSKSKDKNEECKKLVKGLEGGSCRFHGNASLLTKYNNKQRYNLASAWDIEDLVTAGKKLKACPYFGSRELTRGAEVIFCPYNYLIDPLIRSQEKGTSQDVDVKYQMSINLKDQIVVLDEAHNIEDSSREAASVTLTKLQMEETNKDLQDMINAGVMVEQHTCLQMLEKGTSQDVDVKNQCNGMLAWIESKCDVLEKRGFEDEAKVWTGVEFIQMLCRQKHFQLNATSFDIYKDQLSTILAEQESVNKDEEEMRISSKSIACLSSLMLGLEKLLDEDHDYASDYRVALCKSSVMAYVPTHEKGTSQDVDVKNQGPGGWMSRSRRQEKVWTFQINMWCLNPAVVFSEIGEQARCIVLSSGTLSPMSSFQSELGVNFPIQLEANHVIEDKQVWAGNLTVGPSNNAITATYKNSETFSFQDDVGNVVTQICQTIPKGILCFFSSYSMMEKLVKRWKSTGLWERLSNYKIVLTEPRGRDKTDVGELNGALLLAVCRGKISEGLDFSDDNARAVLTVGIPFPNFKDIQVELKRKYNNQHTKTRGLLTGNEWYEIQAFRALNQALGRCIRHKNDWGALLVIDERFSKSQKYVNGLSKWVRSKVKCYHDFQTCLTSMAHFAQQRQQKQNNSVPNGEEINTKLEIEYERAEVAACKELAPIKKESIVFDEKPSHNAIEQKLDCLNNEFKQSTFCSIVEPRAIKSKEEGFHIQFPTYNDVPSDHIIMQDDSKYNDKQHTVPVETPGKKLSATVHKQHTAVSVETPGNKPVVAFHKQDECYPTKMDNVKQPKRLSAPPHYRQPQYKQNNTTVTASSDGKRRFSFRTPNRDNTTEKPDTVTKNKLYVDSAIEKAPKKVDHDIAKTEVLVKENMIPEAQEFGDDDMFMLSSQLLQNGPRKFHNVGDAALSTVPGNHSEKDSRLLNELKTVNTGNTPIDKKLAPSRQLEKTPSLQCGLVDDSKASDIGRDHGREQYQMSLRRSIGEQIGGSKGEQMGGKLSIYKGQRQKKTKLFKSDVSPVRQEEPAINISLNKPEKGVQRDTAHFLNENKKGNETVSVSSAKSVGYRSMEKLKKEKLERPSAKPVKTLHRKSEIKVTKTNPHDIETVDTSLNASVLMIRNLSKEFKEKTDKKQSEMTAPTTTSDTTIDSLCNEDLFNMQEDENNSPPRSPCMLSPRSLGALPKPVIKNAVSASPKKRVVTPTRSVTGNIAIDSPELFDHGDKIDTSLLETMETNEASKTAVVRSVTAVQSAESKRNKKPVLSRRRKNLRTSSSRNTTLNQSAVVERDAEEEDEKDFYTLALNSNEVCKNMAFHREMRTSMHSVCCGSLITPNKVSYHEKTLLAGINPMLTDTTRNVYVVSNSNHVCSLAPAKVNNQVTGLALNSYYDEDEKILYIPQYCKSCLTERTSHVMMGYKTINWRDKRASQVYLFVEKVTQNRT